MTYEEIMNTPKPFALIKDNGKITIIFCVSSSRLYYGIYSENMGRGTGSYKLVDKDRINGSIHFSGEIIDINQLSLRCKLFCIRMILLENRNFS